MRWANCMQFRYPHAAPTVECTGEGKLIACSNYYRPHPNWLLGGSGQPVSLDYAPSQPEGAAMPPEPSLPRKRGRPRKNPPAASPPQQAQPGPNQYAVESMPPPFGTDREYEGGNDDDDKDLEVEREVVEYIDYEPIPEEIIVHVSREDALELLDLRFHDGRLVDVRYAESAQGRGSRSRFIHKWFGDATPPHFSMAVNGNDILMVGRVGGKGQKKQHPFLVVFEGHCRQHRKGCRAKWKAGIREDQLARLWDEEVAYIQASMFVQNACRHRKGGTKRGKWTSAKSSGAAGGENADEGGGGVVGSVEDAGEE